MQITRASIQTLQVGFNKLFGTGFSAVDPRLVGLATVVPSTTRTTTYGWMAKLLRMRKWEGPRLIQNLNTHAYTLTNEPYELTVGVDARDIRDDQLGIYNPIFDELGRAAKRWPDQVLKTVLQTGLTNNGFDSVPFFSATHPLNAAGNQSNNFTSTALTAANFSAVRAGMSGYTGEDGEPLGVMADTLIVPPSLEDTANSIVTATQLASGATNVQKGQAKVVVVPELANQGTTWYVADTSHALKGLVWQLRKAPQLVAKTKVDDDNVFFDREFIWGLDAEGVGGYGAWFLMARAVA
jgi:phage major head subunit gpT-like protein